MTRLKRPIPRRKVVPLTYYIKVVLALAFGMISGLLFSYITRLWFLRTTKVKCEVPSKTSKHTEPIKSELRLLNISMELKATKYFLLIGVMTADRFLQTRAKTIRDTWASKLDSVKVIFFSGEQGNNSLNSELVRLPGVDDTYPPQKKSFLMVKYVYEHHVDEFHWFVRADDDVYIRTDRLSEILHNFNSSEDLMFGQAGLGKAHEKGKLGLEDDENFCVGGVGVVMSQSVVKKVAPYLLTCLNQTASLHEDSELGRCIRRHVGVMCPWAQEVQHMFYQNFETPQRVFTQSISKSAFRNAITVHAIKEPSYMLHVHHHFLASDIPKLQHRAAILNHRVRKNIKSMLRESQNNTRPSQKSYFSGLLPSNCSIPWEFYDKQYLYGLSEPPLSWISGPISEGVRKLVSGVMNNINTEAHNLLKSQEEFKKIHEARIRTHPTLGVQLTISFETLLRSLSTTRSRFPRRAQRLSQCQGRFAPLWKRTLSEMLPSKNQKPSIHFIVPLAGRFDTFLRFLNSYENAFLIPALPVRLLIVYFPDVFAPERHKKVFEEFRAKFPNMDLAWSELLGEFSRARALEFGVHRYGNDSLLFFADVDLVFETEFYHRCRAGAILGKRVYFPLMFSEFNPRIVYHNRTATLWKNSTNVAPPWRATAFSRRTGVWRKYSYGPVCVYSNDVIAVGGLNTTIRGWGLEDLDFYERCLRRNMDVLRAPDLGLVHVYHAQTSCTDPRMNSEQAKMCEDSRRRGIGSEESLVEYMLVKGYV